MLSKSKNPKKEYSEKINNPIFVESSATITLGYNKKIKKITKERQNKMELINNSLLFFKVIFILFNPPIII